MTTVGYCIKVVIFVGQKLAILVVELQDPS